MKNVIKYYYDLDSVSIHQKNKVYSFSANNDSYVLINYSEDDIKEIYEITNYLISNNIKTNKIIINNKNQLLTNINNEMYVLIKIMVCEKKIKIEDVINFNTIYINKSKQSWFELWTKKIDYLEYQINQVGLKYNLIRESFSYYIGLAEMAACLVKNVDSRQLSLSHKRISYNDTSFNLYNPLNYMIDYRFRDVCEYFKSAFFDNIDVIPLIKEYLNNLNNEEKYLFYARLIFPSYYFDYYEKIISNEIDELEINIILSKVDQYEHLLKELYEYLNNVLPNIEYLKKVIQY